MAAFRPLELCAGLVSVEGRHALDDQVAEAARGPHLVACPAAIAPTLHLLHGLPGLANLVLDEVTLLRTRRLHGLHDLRCLYRFRGSNFTMFGNGS